MLPSSCLASVPGILAWLYYEGKNETDTKVRVGWEQGFVLWNWAKEIKCVHRDRLVNSFKDITPQSPELVTMLLYMSKKSFYNVFLLALFIIHNNGFQYDIFMDILDHICIPFRYALRGEI